MNMREIFQRVLSELEVVFRRLEAMVPPPSKVRYRDGYILRYQEKTLQQALLQKFARQISGLHAIKLLLMNGFVQEQGVLQRTLDEICEDIIFLTLGMSPGDWTENHKNYLEYFWMEDLEDGIPGRGMIKRDKIRAYINRRGGLVDPSTADSNGRRIHKALSGYVHANSISVIDMCVGTPPRYHLAGLCESPLYPDHVKDAWNYFYRGLVSSVILAKAFDDHELWSARYASIKVFEAAFAERIFKESVTA